jgi:hypothetical protein
MMPWNFLEGEPFPWNSTKFRGAAPRAGGLMLGIARI